MSGCVEKPLDDRAQPLLAHGAEELVVDDAVGVEDVESRASVDVEPRGYRPGRVEVSARIPERPERDPSLFDLFPEQFSFVTEVHTKQHKRSAANRVGKRLLVASEIFAS